MGEKGVCAPFGRPPEHQGDRTFYTIESQETETEVGDSGWQTHGKMNL